MRVMIAFGGKREKGTRKEKKDIKPAFGAGDVVVIECGGWEDRRERNVKRTVVAKKATTMTTLGGRMMRRRFGICRRRGMNQLCSCNTQGMDFSSEFAIVKAGQRLQRTTLKEFRGAKWTREGKSVVVS